MNKALILLLVTLVPSQSDGVLLPNSNTNDRFRDSQLEDWETPESPPYAVDYSQSSQSYRKRSVTSDAFTRRSSLDKNFMRFGRGGEDVQKYCGRGREHGHGHGHGKLSFYRFGRGLKDNFIRFGRARDNFIRFGRGGGKDGFIRFGRGRVDDFFRPAKSLRENFIRFGRVDRNFPEKSDEDYQDLYSSEEPKFQRLEKSRAQDNFVRFGKNGKNGTNFLRFGKSEAEVEDAEGSEQYYEGPRSARRKRSKVDEKAPGKSSKVESKRATGYFETPAENFPRMLFPILGSESRSLGSLRNSRLTSFFPVFPVFPKSSKYEDSEAKRNQGGSSFIRFG